jgi:deoxyribonuclease IV
MPKIGAHTSGSGGLYKSLEKAAEIGAECSQTFISPPQSWAQPVYSPENIQLYRDKLKETGIGPNFNHGIYLINLATTIPSNLQKDIGWLKYALSTDYQLGLTGCIFHLGSHKGVGFEMVEKQVCSALEEVLKSMDEFVEIPGATLPYLVLENSASKGNALGGKFYELGRLLKAVSHPQLKVCIDTQHAFASGYDLRSKDGVDRMVEELEREVGLSNVIAIHTNDSKMEFDSGRDRHENIGQGLIGEEGFRMLIQHPALQNMPFILEVPGQDDKGPDKHNVDLLKSFRI